MDRTVPLPRCRLWAALLLCQLALVLAAHAAPPAGPALAASFFRRPPEPPGPSSRRAGVVLSEVMYHPAARSDGRDVRFIEVFNSMPWFEDLGGWRLSGDADFTFPAGFVLPARAYVVVAAAPADLAAVTGLSGVLGPFTGSLLRGNGALKLRNRQSAVLFELDYRDDGAWPVAADGAGHSLVLARPSHGERDPKAWAASELIGGSPGLAEPPATSTPRTVVINELLANTDAPAVDLVELFNYSESPVDLSGCVLTDDPAAAKFTLPTHSIIAARGFLSFTETQLGFSLSASGEALFLKAAEGTRVLDAVRFGPQANGVSFGRTPDGAPELRRLRAVTPGAANAAALPSPVVINELMYHPASDDSADEFIELHNPGSVAVPLGGWRIADAVSFTFPAGTTLRAGGYLVVAKAAAHLRTNYAGLGAANLLGDYDGALGNGGERVALSMPEAVLSTNQAGGVVTNVLHIVVDKVSYGTGGRWGKWSDGGGSSLERRDPRGDGWLAPTWGDSDESLKSPWVTVQVTGPLDNGRQTANGLELFLYGAGECLVDNVEVIGPGGTNRLANADFEAGTTNWVFQGNHGASSLATNAGYISTQSLHLRATGPGHTGPNRIRVPLRTSLAAGQTVTLRAKARWLKGTGNFLMRLHGNWQEATTNILAARNLGTPGARNSLAVPNAPPAITEVAHFPVLPLAFQDVTVTARVADFDGLGDVVLRWRRDPATNFTDVVMADHGAGLFSAVIPGQGGATLAAFHLVATDAAATAATASFPTDAPVRECLVRWGENNVNSALGSYRLWLTKATADRWTKREKLSNDPLDATFVQGNHRAIYNAGALYSGSPYHAPSYSGPTSGSCDYVVVFPPDDPLLGETGLNLLQPGNGGGDSTGQQEKHAYWIGAQLGLPFCHRRPVLLYVNGVKRGQVYDDAQQPNGDYIQQWFPDDPDGELRKIQLWFEFDNAGSGFEPLSADLSNYTSGGAKSGRRYRWNWPRRAFGNAPDNFTNLFALVDAVRTPIGGDTYTRALRHATDVDEWFRTHVTEHLVGNNDSYSYGGGQNMYAYKPARGPWRLLIWDIDFAFAAAGPTSDMVGIGGQNVGPVNTHAPFSRLYWQAMLDAANGPLLPARSNPIIDARYQGMRTNGATSLASGNAIKSFVASRRTYLLGLLAARAAALRFTSNGGADFEVAGNFVTLTGNAPLNARVLTLNGRPLDVTWTALTNWTAKVPLAAGTNTLVLAALDTAGQPVTNAPATLRVNFTGTADAPEGQVVISEVLHHPTAPGTGFLELRNLSSTTAYDLSGWRLDGVDLTFPGGSTLAPGAYGLIVEDSYVFAQTHGPLLRPFGVFNGKLKPAGETLRLLRPGLVPGTEVVVDQFTYETGAPWPDSALLGSSLQLMDPAQDNNRVANWSAVAGPGSTTGPRWQQVVATGTGSASALYLYLENAGDAYVDDVRLVAGEVAETGPDLLVNGDFEAAFPGPWIVSSLQTASATSTAFARSGSRSLHLVSSGVGSTRASAITQDLSPALTADATYTLSFWYLPDPKGGTLTARLSGNGIRGSVNLAPGTTVPLARVTPGKLNSVAATLPAFPPVWLNELQTENLSGPTDNFGQREPWVELFAGGPGATSLAGCFLSDSLTNLTRWAFPADASIPAGGHLLVWLDGQPAQSAAGHLHAGFRAATNGLLVLSQVAGGRTHLLDYVRYASPGADRSLGDFPDGDLSSRHLFAQPTPRAANSLAAPALRVFINEWMADNTATIADPADGGFKDWFELFNAGPAPADLAGYFLANSLTNRTQSPIPPGYVIPAGGRRLVWADKKPALNQPTGGDLHADFKLSAGGEAIALFAPDGTLVDAVTFGPQAPDVSEGRAPDGGVVAGPLPSPTPRARNAVPPPELLSIGADSEAATVTWSTFAGLSYQLEGALGLEFPTWQPVGAPRTATGRTLSVAELLGAPTERYYRVRLLP